MTLHRLLTTVRRRLLVILGVIALAVLAAMAYTSRQADAYVATAKLYLTTTTQDKSGSDLVNSGLYASNLVNSVASLASTPAVLDRVVSALDLDTTAQDLAQDVNATVPLNTVVVQIAVTAGDPDRAAAIANAIATQLPHVTETITRPSATVDSPMKLTVIQTAVPPKGKVAPRPLLNIGTGVILGSVAGLALAVLLESFRRRVRSVIEVEYATGLPVIGVLPDEDDHPTAVGSLRVTWASILAAAGHAPRTVLLVGISESAAVPKLGSRLAPVVAETERSVVWVDADLRGGRASAAFGVEAEPGLSEVLAGGAEMDEVIQTWQGTSLSVISSGARTNELGRLFTGPAMSMVTEVLRPGFETTIIDATGVSEMAEVALLGSYVDGVVMVVTPSSTRTTLAMASKALRSAGLRPLGVVVDQVPDRDRSDFERRFRSDDDLVYSD